MNIPIFCIRSLPSRIAGLLTGLGLLLGATHLSAQGKVIGYFMEWGVYSTAYFITNIPATKLTHIDYAFAQVDASNHVAIWDTYAATDMFFPGDCWDPGCERGNFHQIKLLKQAQPQLKFIISIGGWTGSQPFYALAASATARQTFALSCSNFLALYPQFDGVDIDWENPVIGGNEALGKPADAHNFTLLLQAIRGAIGTDKLLTVAVSANPDSITALEYTNIAAAVDWVSVMSYDLHGSWDAFTGHNSALFNHNDPTSSRYNVNGAVQGILARGVPAAKIAAGVPFYGHSWANATSSNLWSAASGAGPGTSEAGTLDYHDLAANYINTNGYTRYWDDVAKVPWLYNPSAKVWVSYDDPQSMQFKGRYIATNHLAGAMFWELSGDNGQLLDGLRAGLTASGDGITPPSLTLLVQQNSNAVLTWSAPAGHTNRVQMAAISAGMPTNWLDVGNPIVPPGSNAITTNWTDVGAVTNGAGRLYRVRIAP